MSTQERDSGATGAAANYDDLRAAPRFTLLIRSAKLVAGDCEYLCVIRDVSASGVRLRVFHAMPAQTQLTLELSSGETFLVERVWERDDHAGFRFSDPIDVHRFIAEASPYPKRALRLRLEFPAVLTADRISLPARVCDLSRQGARIETDQLLAIGQQVKLEAKGLPGIIANVCWRSTPAYGLVFQNTFSFAELAKLAVQFQPLSGTSDDPQNLRRRA